MADANLPRVCVLRKSDCAKHTRPKLRLRAGHLTGWVPPAGERALLANFTALALVCAARKYMQAVKAAGLVPPKNECAKNAAA